jgi:hypothetical protein
VLRNRRGAQIESHYDYPDNYSIKGLGPLSGTDRDLIRLRSMGLDTATVVVKPATPIKRGRKAS